MANNDPIFNAVLSGAIGGFQARWITTTNLGDYTAFLVKATEVANAVDTLIAPTSIDIGERDLMQAICQGVFIDRFPNVDNYSDIAEAIVTLYSAAQPELYPEGGGGGGSVNVTSPLAGDGSVGDPVRIVGGYREAANIAARNAIPANERAVGMTIYDQATDKLWRLIGGILDANWIDVTIGLVSNAVAGLVPAVGAVSLILQSTGTAAAWTAPLTWDSTFLSPTIQQQTTALATGQMLSVKGQQAATTGGGLALASGVGGTTQGELSLSVGATKIGSFQRSNTADFLAFGANPATAGFIRLPPGTGIQSREFAFGSDIPVYVSGTGFNSQSFGGGNLAAVVRLNGSDSGGVVLQTNAVDKVSISSTTYNHFLNNFTIGAVAGASGFTAFVTDTNSGSSAGGFYRIRGMGTTSGNTNGAHGEVWGGRLSGTGLSGRARLALNQDNTLANAWNMLEVAHIGSTGGTGQQRVVSLCFPGTAGAGVTTTQLPVNTGDLVTFIGDRATAPSADGVGGHIYYSDSARPAWRFNSTNLRLDGTAATASAGAATLPAQPTGFLTVTLNGTVQKIPYYNT